jgi:hypothetical protein
MSKAAVDDRGAVWLHHEESRTAQLAFPQAKKKAKSYDDDWDLG